MGSGRLADRSCAAAIGMLTYDVEHPGETVVSNTVATRVPRVIQEAVWREIQANTHAVDGQSPHVREDDNGLVYKVFRNRRPSPAPARKRALRFLVNAEKLRELDIVAPVCREFLLIAESQTHVVTYPIIPGCTFRLIQDDAESPSWFRDVAAFLSELHRCGVFFRGAHLGNLLALESGGVGIIDMAGTRFRGRVLTPFERARNLRQLFCNSVDVDFWTPHRVAAFTDAYIDVAEIGPFARSLFTWRLAISAAPTT